MVSDAEERDNPNSADDLAVGAMLYRYRITRKIRAGGMGVVYEAEDTELKRTVAVKLLPAPEESADDALAQFQREARMAASLDHPNLITIHDVGEYQGQPFFVMEYVEGESLQERLGRGPMAVDEVIEIATQVCQGLAEAHRAGLTHRDLKPSNILIDRSGRVRILDFGLATMRASQPAADDRRSGTLSYMSPEQVNEEDITPASDLFALGVLLYEMLTGRRPFEGDYEASLIYSIVNDTPKPLEACRSDIPPKLRDIVRRLLQKDVSLRYQQANDVVAELQSVAGGEEPEQPKPVGKRRTFISTLILVMLIAVTAIWFYPWSSDTDVTPSRRMLAVLPFDNLGEVEDDYFADGVVDAITTHLARIGGLGVVSRTSSMEYRDSGKGVRQIGSELGCQLLITGSVHWDKSTAPSRVRVDARLVRVADDTHLWADSYERRLEGVFELQSEIARDVASALQLVMRESDRQALMARPTDNLDAYDFYLRGNQYFNRSWEQDDIEIATAMYQRAVDLDPEFALAYSMLSRGHESMYWEYYDHTVERKELAREAVDRALELEPGLADGHLALGYYYYHCELDYERALEEFQLALDRRPNNAELVSAIAAVQRRVGPIESAVDNFVRASELDPRSHLKLFDVGLTYGMIRQYDRATVYLDRAIALAPDWPMAHVYKAWLEIIRGGHIDRAAEILDEGSERAALPRSHYYWWLARIVRPDLNAVLAESRPGADTVVYYLHCAQMNRLLERFDIERAYADSARVILESRTATHPDNARFHSHLGLAYTGLRRQEEAINHATRAMDLLPTTRDAYDALFYAVNMVEVLVVFKEYDAAVEQLRFLLSIPGFVSPSYLKLDPLWLPLHDHPAWPDLISQADGR